MSTLFFHFKKILYRYREQTQVELSNDLIRWNFLQLAQGKRTALIVKVEEALGYSIEVLLQASKDDQKPDAQYKTMYTTQFMLEKSLEPRFNRMSRSATADHALKKKKGFFIAKCKRHSTSLFIVRSVSDSRCVACSSRGQADNILEAVREYLKIIGQEQLVISI